MVELIVVIGVIVLLASISLPSIATLFTSGSEAQAYNLFQAQLAAARALAVREGTSAKS